MPLLSISSHTYHFPLPTNTRYSQFITSIETISLAMYSFLYFILLLLFADCSIGQIQLGSQLSARDNQAWVSGNRTFAFGFAPTGSSDKFLLAIWYADLPGDLNIVWSPNRDMPVSANAAVRLDESGNLKLTDRNALVWASNTSNQRVDLAVMLDSGSFILYNGTGTGRQVAWQSFGHPSDTLLPGQPLEVALELTSNRSQFGYYSLKMLQQHTSLSLALTFVTFDSRTNYSYWSSPQISNATGNIVAVLDYSGSFSITYGEFSTGTVYIRKNDIEPGQSFLRQIKIGADGNLRLYQWNDTTLQWDVKWSAVSNPCEVAGICGNGICNLDGTGVDASCTSLPPMNSGNCSTNLTMDRVPQTNYYFLGPSTIANYSNVSLDSECSEHCLSNCDCVAAVYGLVEEKTYCWTLRSMIFGGLQDPSSTLFVKVGNAGDSGSGGSRSIEKRTNDAARRDRTILLPLLLCVSVLVVLLGLLLCYGLQKRRIRLKREELCSSLSLPGAPLYFSYHDLQAATCNFSQLLGTGGFGSVYKGALRDGTSIAVKKLERFLPHGEKEFVTEVTTIGLMHHMNLVTLRGFCSERTHRLLVYEYMSNGSLDKWIFPSNSRQGSDRLLDWRTRFQIAVAIAQGIAYFHEQCKNRIIHCDIKPENILLDEDFCPKVSDFGLAKLMSREHSHVVTMVRGTRGYLAPEWVSNRLITVKADVYSYGMLLLEIIGGRRNLDMSLDSEEFFYPGWAFKELMNGTALKAVDKSLRGNVEEEELVRGLNAAFWCIQDEAWVRPSMGEVVRMLDGSVDINVPPMPQAVVELVEEGLHSVYMAMRRDYSKYPFNSSSVIYSQRSSQATCSYSTLSPR